MRAGGIFTPGGGRRQLRGLGSAVDDERQRIEDLDCSGRDPEECAFWKQQMLNASIAAMEQQAIIDARQAELAECLRNPQMCKKATIGPEGHTPSEQDVLQGEIASAQAARNAYAKQADAAAEQGGFGYQIQPEGLRLMGGLPSCDSIPGCPAARDAVDSFTEGVKEAARGAAAWFLELISDAEEAGEEAKRQAEEAKRQAEEAKRKAEEYDPRRPGAFKPPTY